MSELPGRTPAESTLDPEVEARIDTIIGELTLAEKAGQLTQYFYFGAAVSADVDTAAATAIDPQIGQQAQMVEGTLAAGGAGSLLFVNKAAETNRLQRLAIEGSRQGIPVIFGFDVIHGLRTILPVPIAMAASWDPATISAGQAVAAREARAVGIQWTFAPMVDIARDPRWGRIIEGAGEDPFLGAAVAAAQVRGFQGDQLGAAEHVIAGPKHFAGYGYGIGGRDYDEVNLSDSEFWNVVVPPFRAAIEAGAGNIMTAYMGLNGVPATGNRWLLHDVLRGELGFDGFIVSDAQAAHNLVTHGFAADLTDAAARGVSVGMDLEMAMFNPAYAHVVEAVEQGLLSETDVDASVRRVLRAKITMGLFEDPYVDEDAAATVLADPVHRDVARVTAERSAVLLRNEGAVLPLDAETLGSVAVLGPLAASKRDIIGPWVFDFDLDESVTIVEGLQARLGDRVSYAPGVGSVQRTFPSMFDMFGGNKPADAADFDAVAELDRAVALAAASEVAVVVVGEWQNMIGEGASRSSLELPGDQLALLQAVVATGTPTVAVIMNGRPLDLRWAAQNVPAILDVWYPGTHGGHAVANLLLGDVEPGGKLPFSWPRTVGQVPMIYSHLISHDPANAGKRYWDEESTPLFAFGHGLSYTTFGYDDLSSSEAGVTVKVTNTGDRAGDEVVQLYTHQRSGSAARPVRELKGFRRVRLEAGESQLLTFPLGEEQLRYWSAATRDWTDDATEVDVWVGGSSTADLHTTFTARRGDA